MYDTTANYGVPYQAGSGYVNYASIAAPAPARRSARNALILLALFILPVSLIPATWGRVVMVPLVGPVWWTDLAICPFAVFAILFRRFSNSKRRLDSTSKSTFLFPMIALGLWQCLSAAWNGREANLKGYSVLEAVFMMCAIVAAFQLVSGQTNEYLRKFARLATVLLGGIICVYIMLSFIFPGWRPSHAYTELVTTTLGFIRVHGPLASSTTLNFILVPALALSIGALLSRQSARWWWTCCALFFIAAILGTGSRGGLVCLGVLGFTLTIALGLRSFLVLVPVTFLFISAIIFVGIPERFRSFEDDARLTTYATAWRGFTSTPESVLIGLGHGALYSRLHDESMRKAYGEHRWYLISDKTAFGPTLRSSHTALMRTLVETGLLGGCLLYGTLFVLAVNLLRRTTPANQSYVIEGKALLAGCIAVIPNMALDEFFVGAPWVLLFWVIYSLVGVEMVRAK